MGGAMSVEMQPKMTMVLAGLLAALAVLGAACGHRAATGPNIAALQPSTPPEPGPAYRIQLGDELHVRFLYQPDMDELIPVRPDGRISLGATGEMTVLGLTPPDLERLIVERSAKRLRNPEVTVVVTKLGEQRVYVGGEVDRAGYVVLRPDMTPLQAVMQVGGFK